jgi:hypothetical protein
MCVVESFDAGLSAKLRLSAEQRAEMSIPQKLRMYIERMDPEGELGPLATEQLIADVQGQLFTLHKLQESIPGVKVKSQPGDVKLSDAVRRALEGARATEMPPVRGRARDVQGPPNIGEGERGTLGPPKGNTPEEVAASLEALRKAQAQITGVGASGTPAPEQGGTKPRIKLKSGEAQPPGVDYQAAPGTKTAGSTTGVTPDSGKLARLRRSFEQFEAAVAEGRKRTSGQIARLLRDKVLDHASSVKSELAGKTGGMEAEMKFIAIQGAGAKAQQRFLSAARNIWGELDDVDVKNLDMIIEGRRAIAVDDYKGQGKQKRMSGLSGNDMRQALAAMEQELGSEKFAKCFGAVFPTSLWKIFFSQWIFSSGVTVTTGSGGGIDDARCALTSSSIRRSGTFLVFPSIWIE